MTRGGVGENVNDGRRRVVAPIVRDCVRLAGRRPLIGTVAEPGRISSDDCVAKMTVP